MTRQHLPCVLSLATIINLMSWPICVTQAQSVDPRATALFNEAIIRMDKRDYASACPMLEEVVRIIPRGIGANIELGHCYEETGRLASAWRAYTEAMLVAEKLNDTERRKFADEHSKALEPKLSKITIVVPDAVRELDGLVIQCDGFVVDAARWGVALPIDKGFHPVAAMATGRLQWQRTVNVATDGISVTITVDQLPELVAPLAKPKILTPQVEPQVVAPSLHVPTWAWAVGGAGLTFAAGSIAFLVDERFGQSIINDHCPPPDRKCRPADFDYHSTNERVTRDFGLFVGLGAGSLAMLVASAVGIATASPATSPTRASVRAVPWANLNRCGGSLVVEF